MTHDDLKQRAQWVFDQAAMGPLIAGDASAQIVRDLLTALEAAEARSKADEEAMREALKAFEFTKKSTDGFKSDKDNIEFTGRLTTWQLDANSAAIAKLTERLETPNDR